MCPTEFRGRPLRLALLTIDARDIEVQCHGGPRDCERAIDQVLLAAPAPGK